MEETQREIEAALGVGHAKRHVPGWLLWGGAAILAGGLTLWWMQGADDRTQVSYVTETAHQGDLTVTVTATGTIEPTNQVEISSELSGTIAEVLVDYNDAVTAGQILARLDTVQLDAQLSVQAANHAAVNVSQGRTRLAGQE